MFDLIFSPFILERDYIWWSDIDSSWGTHNCIQKSKSSDNFFYPIISSWLELFISHDSYDDRFCRISILSSSSSSLRDGKLCMLSYTYPHKPLRKINVTMCNHQVYNSFTCDLMSALVICNKDMSMVIHGIECLY